MMKNNLSDFHNVLNFDYSCLSTRSTFVIAVPPVASVAVVVVVVVAVVVVHLMCPESAAV